MAQLSLSNLTKSYGQTEAFGATGLMINTPDEIGLVLKKAFEVPGPVILGVHVDYRDNHKLFEMVNENRFH